MRTRGRRPEDRWSNGPDCAAAASARNPLPRRRLLPLGRPTAPPRCHRHPAPPSGHCARGDPLPPRRPAAAATRPRRATTTSPRGIVVNAAKGAQLGPWSELRRPPASWRRTIRASGRLVSTRGRCQTAPMVGPTAPQKATEAAGAATSAVPPGTSLPEFVAACARHMDPMGLAEEETVVVRAVVRAAVAEGEMVAFS